jgi:hypothetical protein
VGIVLVLLQRYYNANIALLRHSVACRARGKSQFWCQAPIQHASTHRHAGQPDNTRPTWRLTASAIDNRYIPCVTRLQSGRRASVALDPALLERIARPSQLCGTRHGLRCRPRAAASAHARRSDVPTWDGFQYACLGCVRPHAAARSTPMPALVTRMSICRSPPSWSESRGRRSCAALATGCGVARARRHRLKHGGRTEPTWGLMLPKRLLDASGRTLPLSRRAARSCAQAGC